MAPFNTFMLAVVLCSAHAEYDKHGEFPETGQDVMHNLLEDMKGRLDHMEERLEEQRTRLSTLQEQTIRQQDQKIQTLSTRLLHQEEVTTTQSQQLKHQQEYFEKRFRQQKAFFRKELISQRKYFQKQNGRLLKDLGLSLKSDRETEVDKQLFHVHEKIAAQTDKKMAEQNGTPARPEEDYHHGDVSSSFAQLKRSDDNALETALAHVAQQMAAITSEIQALKNVNEQQDDVIANRGTSYIRWGHTGCPASADLVYTGIIGGAHRYSTGGAANHLCLTSHPAFDGHRQPTGNANADIYGSEYEICPEPECQLTPACAACRVPRTTSLMIPGTNVCSSEWTKEYSGYIMAGYHGQSGSSEFICVDSSHGYINTSQNNDNQNLIYYTHAKCGALPCPPYVDDKLVTCVVCSK